MASQEQNTNMNLKSGIFNIGKKHRMIATEGTLIAILALLFIILSIASDSFLTVYNLANLVRQTAIIGIVAIGMTFVIIAAGIDLSVGSVVGFSGVLAAILMNKGVSILVAVIISIALGTLIGLINGIIIYDGKVPPFIATLGAMTVVRGVIMLISNARMIGGLPKAFTNFAQKDFLRIPSLFIVWLIIILLATFIMKKTHFGRNVYAIGSNEEAARLSGINIRKNMYSIYAICAFMSAVAGILMTSRLGNGIPTGGMGYELDAIAAAVIGGASLSGAEGTIFGTVLGAI
ncbi:MAG: ribose transport system permease protein, partial [Clostridiales bacterium]|nr:ribose transport system permease protein [Clostridiales bacterium]